jgi:hypothetical protein
MASVRIRAHPTIDLPRNDSGAGAVTIGQANAPAAGGPAGRGVRASDLNGPGVLPAGAVRQARNSKSAWRPSAVTSAHRLCQVLHAPWRSSGGQEASPVWPLAPLLWRRAKHGHLVAQSRSRARGRLQVRAGGSRGGAPYGSRPQWWTGCQIERWCNGRRYVGSAGGLRLARRSSASAVHGTTPGSEHGGVGAAARPFSTIPCTARPGGKLLAEWGKLRAGGDQTEDR